MIVLVLLWGICLLILIHIHLTTRDELIFSSFADTLDTLATLIPDQSKQVADAILTAVGAISTHQSVQQLESRIEQEVKDELEQAESNPYSPPWDELPELKVDLTKTRGEWG